MSRIIIGIPFENRKPYRQRIDLCQKTWLSDAEELGVDYVLIAPKSRELIRDGHTLYCPGSGGYRHLFEQVVGFCRWAITQSDWEYLFKCDDDTYVSIPRLLAYPTLNSDYIGRRFSRRPIFAVGGAGYLLSRRAVEVIANRKYSHGRYEDRRVAETLNRADIKLTSDERFTDLGDKKVPRLANDFITGHKLSLKMWMTAHEETGYRLATS